MKAKKKKNRSDLVFFSEVLVVHLWCCFIAGECDTFLCLSWNKDPEHGKYKLVLIPGPAEKQKKQNKTNNETDEVRVVNRQNDL